MSTHLVQTPGSNARVSPGSKLKRLFLRYRSHSEAHDDVEAAKITAQTSSDVYICPNCAQTEHVTSTHPQGKESGNVLNSPRRSCDSGVPQMEGESSGCSGTPENSRRSSDSYGGGFASALFPLPNHIMKSKMNSGPASRRDSCSIDTNETLLPVRKINDQQTQLVCVFCMTTITAVVTSSTNKVSPKDSLASDCSQKGAKYTGAPKSLQLCPRRRHSTPYSNDNEIDDDDDDIDSATENAYFVNSLISSQQSNKIQVSLEPPKEPSKLPLSPPNSGMQFIDSNMKLASTYRPRSISLTADSRPSRSLKFRHDRQSRTTFGLCNEYFLQTLKDTRDLNVLVQALELENSFSNNGNTSRRVSPPMSRISENSRYIMFSRTPCLQNCKSSQEGTKQFSDELFATLFRHCSIYDTLPESGKLIVLYSGLSVDSAYNALSNNLLTAAPIWDSDNQCYIGVMTLSHFIPICYHYCSYIVDANPATYRRKSIAYWRNLVKDYLTSAVFFQPDTHLHEVLTYMKSQGSKHCIAYDDNSGNVLGVLSFTRMFRFLCMKRREVIRASPLWMQSSIEVSSTNRGLPVHWFQKEENNDDDNICRRYEITLDTPILKALELFMQMCSQSKTFAMSGNCLAVVASETDKTLVHIFTDVECVHFLLNANNTPANATVGDCLKSNIQVKKPLVCCAIDERVDLLMDKFFYHDVECVALMSSDNADHIQGLIYLDEFLYWLIFSVD